MAGEEKKSRVLVIGATGRLGQELVKASLVAGHPTLAVARESAFSVPHKSSLLRSFVGSGVTVLKRLEMAGEEKKSRVLVIGATGRLGQELVKASLVAGHPTLAVARESAFSVPHKSSLLRSFVGSGVTVLKVSLSDYANLLGAVKQADIVISALPAAQYLEQKILIQAIKEAGCVRRFIPSEFGADPDKVQILGMDMGFYKKKAEIRRLIESEGIPHTYISCNFFMTYLLPSLVQPGSKIPPRDKVKIYGNGNSKAVFVKESDVAAFTISSIDDPRTLNKVLYLRPPGNVVSMNELVDLWEMKIAKNLQKDYIPEEKLLKNIQDMPYPDNMELVFIYSAFIKGDHTYFNIDEAGVDAIRLYPNVKYTTVSQFIDTLLYTSASNGSDIL